jgi:hypothetical protein
MRAHLLIIFVFTTLTSVAHVKASLFNRCSKSVNAMSNFTGKDLDNMDWYEAARSPSSTNNCTRFYIIVEENELVMQQSYIT